jgi:molybdenum cofactor cytidylyltransferase
MKGARPGSIYHATRDERRRHVIPAIVLAAGKSSRMGRPKATLPVDAADTFLARIVGSFHAAGVQDVVVVLGHDAGPIEESMVRQGIAARIVVNARYEEGQLSSLLAGLEAADRPDVEAVLMTLVDVPLVSAATIESVIERYRATGAPIVRPVRGADHGHPVLMARRLFGLLRAANPGQGAKPIVRAFASSAGDVPCDDDGAFSDVDTPEDYERLIRSPDSN